MSTNLNFNRKKLFLQSIQNIIDVNQIYLFFIVLFIVLYTLYEIILYYNSISAHNSYKFLQASKSNTTVFEKSDLMLIANLFRIYRLLCNAMIIIILYYLSNVITGYTKQNRSINNLIFTYKLLVYAALYIFWIIAQQYGSNNFCCNINTHYITLYRKSRIIYTLIILEIKSVIMVIISISEY